PHTPPSFPHDALPILRPSHFAGKAERVEQRRLVLFDARRQHYALPRVRGDLAAVELLDHFAQTVRPGEPIRHVLPVEEEAHEVRSEEHTSELQSRVDL